MSLWPPSNVVEKHRKVAQAVWAFFIVAFIAYSAYHIRDTFNQRNDPPVSVKIESKGFGQFPLPDIAVCLAPGRGCNNAGATARNCIESGKGTVLLKDGFDTEQEPPKVKVDPVNPDSCFLVELSKAQKVGKEDKAECGEDGALCSRLTAAINLKWAVGALEDGDTLVNSVDVKLYTPAELLKDNKKVLNLVDFDPAKIAPAAVVPVKYVQTTAGAAQRTEMPLSRLLITLERVKALGVSGAVGYKAATSYFTSLQSLTSMPVEQPIAAGEAVLQFEVAVTQLWYNSTEEQDPVTFMGIAETIYALWPNVLLLFGLIFVSRQALAQEPEQELRPFKQELRKAHRTIKKVSGRSWATSSERRDSTASDTKLAAGETSSSSSYLYGGAVEEPSKSAVAPVSHTGSEAPPVRRATLRMSDVHTLEELSTKV